MIYVFEKSDDKDYYKKAKAFRIENNVRPPRRVRVARVAHAFVRRAHGGRSLAAARRRASESADGSVGLWPSRALARAAGRADQAPRRLAERRAARVHACQLASLRLHALQH